MTSAQPSAAAGVQIRDARASDSAACAALLSQLGYPSSSERVRARLERLAAERLNRAFVAESGGNVIALATAFVRPLIHKDEAFLRIASLIVDEQWRDRGVGRALVATIEAWGREEGCGVSEVTSGEQRADAHRFYASLGYVEKRKRFVKEL